MAEAPENLEWSLHVPSVKELAIERPETVPPRYIRDDIDHPIAAPSDPLLCVPLIDMTKLVNPENQEMELQKLHAACKDWGMFQLINHRVSSTVLRSMKEKTEEFFSLPLQEKERCAQKPGSLEGYGQAFVISEEQKLEWCDMIFLKSLPAHIRNLEFWPITLRGYREAIESYSQEMRELAVSLVGFIEMALGLSSKAFSKAFQDGEFDLRMNCYPPCPQPERFLGIAPHADISGITFLLECGELPGLQFLKDEQWVSIKPINEAIVVNLGHISEIMSNGIYKAPKHRAIVNRLKERLSIVTFCYPSSSIDIGPAMELISKARGSSPLYKTLTIEDYWQSFYNWKLGPVPFIDTLKL